jgi:membrane peptidoglycan carboxypeptidase
MRSFRPIWLLFMLAIASSIVAAGIWATEEMRSSKTQARNFAHLAGQMTADLQQGANPQAWFPEAGPYNQRLGYAYLPYFIKSLQSSGFEIAWQTRPSSQFIDFAQHWGFPIYDAKTTAGLSLYDRRGVPLTNAQYPTRTFANFSNIPPLLTNTLLFIENRELLEAAPPTKNPAIEWNRLGLATVGHIAGMFFPSIETGGGSTLATQIEKFRFSPDGQTGDAREKLRQILSASMRVYNHGQDTGEARKKIVLDYLNATPLSARPGWGEVNGIGDGLWAWFGRELTDVELELRYNENDPTLLRDKALAYRHVLALILAQRRPSYYLMNDRAALEDLVDITLQNLTNEKVITPKLRDAAASARLLFLAAPPPIPGISFVTQKAVNAVRTQLLGLFGTQNLYELDRFDMRANTTLDMPVQQQVTDFLQKLKDPGFIQQSGLVGERLLGSGNDPTKVQWTIVVYERGDHGNEVRVQADNLDQPLDLNEGVKLDLGSTAKLRTLITYLEIIAELHERYATLDEAALAAVTENAPDTLTQWVATWLQQQDDKSLTALMVAAMQRSYSASPGETFFTGGGIHNFNNFEKNDNGKIVTIAESFRHSINLPFVRLMRDIVNYTVAQGPNQKRALLGDPEHPARRAYLERFAEREGAVFLSRYFADYRNLEPAAALEKILQRGRQSAAALAVVYRSLQPKADIDSFANFMHERLPDRRLSDSQIKQLYDNYAIDRWKLADRGYIAGVNPLELWLVSWLQQHAKGTRAQMLAASRDQRLETYSWLFTTRHKAAQDSRIRILLEQDAFATIHQRWARLGYPFERLVPSLATAIGSSADKPGALADLMGIIENDGVKIPTVRLNMVEFAPKTPYHTVMVRHDPKGERVLPPEVVTTVRTALLDVVNNGTARRVKDAFVDSNGNLLPIGGKTGTGDHRFDEFAPGGRLISSRVVNRTATFVFFVGDRLFGSVTAYVSGPEAAKYSFTSALPAQMLKVLAPSLQPLLKHEPAALSAVETAPAISLR